MLDFEDLEARRGARGRRRVLRQRRRRALGALAVVALAGGIAVGASAGPPSPATSARTHAKAGARTRAARHHHHRAAPARTGLTPGAGADATVPILMYHVIAAAPLGAPFPQLYVVPQEFAAQMRALYRAGWTAVTMDQLWDAWHGGARLPAGHPIVISFDNGYSSQSRNAYPVLRRLHWPGVENVQLTGLPRSQGGLSAAAIRRMIAGGWELDTQGRSHADLVTLDAAQLKREVADTRRILQRRYGVPVHWFCYPSGHYDATVVAAVRAAGFRGSTTVVPGWARRSDDPYRLPRLRVVSGTTPQGLLAQIAAQRHAPPAPPSYGT
jgi:peptidoglycan/xylan/chitin deacetylase (PgdA/CDA1 family)